MDGSGAKPIQNGLVVVSHGKISAVGTRDTVRIPEDATKIDCSGKTVMPGLFDCHVHLVAHQDSDPYTGFGFAKKSSAGWAIESVATAKTILDAGITTVRDLGSPSNITVELRDAINQGIIAGPRILSCNSAISMTGGHGDSFRHSRFEGLGHAEGIGVLADGVDAVRLAVREQIKAGADWIKTFASGGALETRRGRSAALEYSFDELKAITEEASRAGKMCAAHCLPDGQTANCVDAGFKTIEHGVFAGRGTLEKMRDKGVSLIPTLLPYYSYAEDGLDVPETAIESARRASKSQREVFKTAMEVGVNIGLGTDGGSARLLYATSAREVSLMVKFGMSPSQAIATATSGSAKALGLADQLGTLESGKIADLLIVKGDVLKDVTTLQERNNIDAVMKCGEFVRRNSPGAS